MGTRTGLLAMIGALVLATGIGEARPPAASAAEVHPLLIGAELPEVALMSADGKAFDLSAAVAKQPTILIFYRGGW